MARKSRKEKELIMADETPEIASDPLAPAPEPIDLGKLTAEFREALQHASTCSILDKNMAKRMLAFFDENYPAEVVPVEEGPVA